MLISVLIKTIGRHTVQNAIDSAIREGFEEIIVVSDGRYNIKVENAKLIELPKNWGSYGSVAANVGVGFCTNEYIMMLDDDDELEVGAGDILRERLTHNPKCDIWIPGLKYKNGELKCCPTDIDKNKIPIIPGVVAVPIYKTKVLTTIPFRSEYNNDQIEEHIDYCHIKEAVCDCGFTIDWIQHPTYLVRPQVKNDFGRGTK